MNKTYLAYIVGCLVVAGVFSCQPNQQPKRFSVDGSFANTGAKKIFLAELPFGSGERTVVDTASLDTAGQFSLSAVSKGEGMYQVFIEKGPGMMVINDQDHIELHADAKHLGDYTVTGSANGNMKKMFREFMQQDSLFRLKKLYSDSISKLPVKTASKDSLLQVASAASELSLAAMRRVLRVFIETEPNGTAVYFATGMARRLNTEEDWNGLLQTGLKRFPNHPGLQLLKVSNSSQNSMDQQGQQLVGKIVPEISLPDTSGKLVSVSSFRGKWVLIDFWASWCAPCRAENPNVVAALAQFKNSNFTVLGISLDLQKGAWTKAIRQDGLNWTHVSDLKQWQSKAVEVYGFNGIPFNILVDPAGKVAAVNLRGNNLVETLKVQLGKK